MITSSAACSSPALNSNPSPSPQLATGSKQIYLIFTNPELEYHPGSHTEVLKVWVSYFAKCVQQGLAQVTPLVNRSYGSPRKPGNPGKWLNGRGLHRLAGRRDWAPSQEEQMVVLSD